jgi:hypothetical protein
VLELLGVDANQVRQSNTASAVAMVHVLVDAAAVVKKGKQLYYIPVDSSLIGQHQAVGPHSRPVGNSVAAPPIDLELLAQVMQQFVAVKDRHRQIEGLTFAKYLIAIQNRDGNAQVTLDAVISVRKER